MIFNDTQIVLDSNFLIDFRDGKKYKVTRIDTQYWMAENLNFKSEDGSNCYDNDENNCIIYGRLYNFNSAMTSCPNGWHLPTLKEWESLAIFISNDNGGLYSESWHSNNFYSRFSISHLLKSPKKWNDTLNIVYENKYGFSAIPGGYNYILDGTFSGIMHSGNWWVNDTASVGWPWNSLGARHINILNNTNIIKWFNIYPGSHTSNYWGVNNQLSVRCIKNSS